MTNLPAFPLAVYGPIGLFLLWRGWGIGYSALALAGLYLDHLTHPYASPDPHFGVSSPLWDVVFRTR